MNIKIDGIPKPQARPRFSSRGKFVKVYSPKSDWRKHLEKEFKKLDFYFDSAIVIDLDFYMPRPKSHYRSGKFSHIKKDNAPEYHISKPDIDNLTKPVFDAMEDAGILSNDSIIIGGERWKTYGDEPGVEILVRKLDC